MGLYFSKSFFGGFVYRGLIFGKDLWKKMNLKFVEPTSAVKKFVLKLKDVKGILSLNISSV